MPRRSRSASGGQQEPPAQRARAADAAPKFNINGNDVICVHDDPLSIVGKSDMALTVFGAKPRVDKKLDFSST